MPSIVFTTLVLYLLVLPGILLQGGYSRGGLYLPWNRKGKGNYQAKKHPTYPVNARGVSEEILKAVLAATVLHFVWGVLSLLFRHPVDYLLVYEVILGRATADSLKAPLERNWGPFLVYFITIIAAPSAIGRYLLNIVREWRLDVKTKIFRFNDPWFYLLRGEILDTPELMGEMPSDEEVGKIPKSKEIDAVIAIALVEIGKDSFAYIGYIREWEVAESNQLRHLVLSSVYWCKVEPGVGYMELHPYQNDLFVLDYAKVQSLSLRYIESNGTEPLPPSSIFPYKPPERPIDKISDTHVEADSQIECA